jgi:hypothetical protein
MMVWGVAFLPPHSVVANIDGTRHRLFYLAGDQDAVSTRASLTQFLEAKTYLSAVLLVNRAATLVQFSHLLRRHARRIYAVLVCDSLAELLAHSIPLLDGTRTAGTWWRTAGTVAELLSAKLARHRNTLKLARLRRRTVVVTDAATVAHGTLAKFAATVTTTIGQPKRVTRLLRAVYGRLVGTVSAREFKATLTILRTRHVPETALAELLRYQHSPKGRALQLVFYRMQRGDDFRELQIQHKHLDMDDWLVVNEIWSAVEPHALVSRPK